MALVIFCVALVEAMRTRMSLSEAILSSPRRSDLRSDRNPLFRHAQPCAGHATPCLSSTLKDMDAQELVSRVQFFFVCASRTSPTCTGEPAMTALSKCLGVTLDHALQLGGGIVAEIAGVADGIEDID